MKVFATVYFGRKPKPNFNPPPKAPLTLPPTDYRYLDYVLQPLEDYRFSGTAEVTRCTTIDFQQLVIINATTWREDNIIWLDSTPRKPYLVSLHNNDETEFPSYEQALANNGIDPVTSAFLAHVDETFEIEFISIVRNSDSSFAHPIYWDIDSGYGEYNATANELKLQGAQPVLRDTMMLYKYAEQSTPNQTLALHAWRLKTSEVEGCMIHCHTLQHMIMGMQSVWVVGNHTELLASAQIPEVQGYLTYSGSVYSNESHWPTVVEFQDDRAQMQN